MPSYWLEHKSSWIPTAQNTQYTIRSMPVSKKKKYFIEPETFCDLINQLFQGDFEINIDIFKHKITKYDANLVYGISSLLCCR